VPLPQAPDFRAVAVEEGKAEIGDAGLGGADHHDLVAADAAMAIGDRHGLLERGRGAAIAQIEHDRSRSRPRAS